MSSIKHMNSNNGNNPSSTNKNTTATVAIVNSTKARLFCRHADTLKGWQKGIPPNQPQGKRVGST